jgi:hypothetical protein
MLIPQGPPKSLPTLAAGVYPASHWLATMAHLPGPSPDSGAGKTRSNDKIDCLKDISDSRLHAGAP